MSRQLAPISAGFIAAAAAVLLTWKSLGPSPRVRPRGNNSAARRVKPPSVWPAVSTATNSAPPPTSASAPRRLTVGGAGSVATSPSTSGGSGRVSAREVRSTLRNDKDRTPVTILGNLISTWTTKPAMKTHAP